MKRRNKPCRWMAGPAELKQCFFSPFCAFNYPWAPRHRVAWFIFAWSSGSVSESVCPKSKQEPNAWLTDLRFFLFLLLCSGDLGKASCLCGEARSGLGRRGPFYTVAARRASLRALRRRADHRSVIGCLRRARRSKGPVGFEILMNAVKFWLMRLRLSYWRSKLRGKFRSMALPVLVCDCLLWPGKHSGKRFIFFFQWTGKTLITVKEIIIHIKIGSVKSALIDCLLHSQFLFSIPCGLINTVSVELTLYKYCMCWL